MVALSGTVDVGIFIVVVGTSMTVEAVGVPTSLVPVL